MLEAHSKTFLFFPIEIGLAHIIRSLAVAEALADQGHQIVFALPKRKQSLIASTKVKLVDISGYSDKDGIDFIPKLNDRSFLEPVIEEELTLINKYRPDAVINDFRLSALAASYLAGVPSFFITGSGGLPYGCYLPNLGVPPFVHTLILPIIQKAIWNLKLKHVRNLSKIISDKSKPTLIDEIFENVKYIVPEQSFYLPHVNKKLSVHYSGPISWDGFDQHAPSWLKKLLPNGKTVYLTFGGTGFDKDKMLGLSQRLLDKGYTVVVSASSIVDSKAFKSHPRLQVEKYLPGKEISQRVDIVVCHGGYGTMMEAVMAGTPVVAIPFNPDQLLHALRFQELGLAKTLITSKLKLFMNLLKFNWKDLENAGKEVSVEETVQAVEVVLAQKSQYTQAIKIFTKKMKTLDGAVSAANFIVHETR